MSKRANGEGTVYQRKDGRWAGATYVLRPDGGRQRRQVYGLTRAEVSGKLRDLITQTERGVPMTGSTWTVETYSKHWLGLVMISLRPSTWTNYAWAIRKYLLPTLGRIRLDRLTPAHVRELHAAVASAGVSARTVQLVHAVLRSMLAEAVREEYLNRNVGSLVRAPRLEKKDTMPWSSEEVARFSVASSSHRLHALFLVAYAVGLRRGEILGLRWVDVDLAQGLLHVRQTLQRLGSGQGVVIGPPKTMRSRRTVPLAASVVEELARHRDRQEAEQKSAGDAWHETGLVFTNPTGVNLEPTGLKRAFDALTQEAGLRQIRFHDLRHTSASLLFAQGVQPRVVMDILGHSTLSITTDLYAHIMPSTLVDAATAMERALSEGRPILESEV